MMVRAVTAGTANIVASPARQRDSLSVLNQSTTATIYIAFDTPAVAAATAGQITLGPIGATGQDPSGTVAIFRGPPNTIPWGAVNVIASAANVPVTILE